MFPGQWTVIMSLFWLLFLTGETTLVCLTPHILNVVVQSPFRAKHHVVMQCMAAGLKCPLPPSPLGPPLWTACSMTGGRQGGQGRIDEQGRIDNITNAARDFALQLPWALLLVQVFDTLSIFIHSNLRIKAWSKKVSLFSTSTQCQVQMHQTTFRVSESSFPRMPSSNILSLCKWLMAAAESCLPRPDLALSWLCQVCFWGECIQGHQLASTWHLLSQGGTAKWSQKAAMSAPESQCHPTSFYLGFQVSLYQQEIWICQSAKFLGLQVTLHHCFPHLRNPQTWPWIYVGQGTELMFQLFHCRQWQLWVF